MKNRGREVWETHLEEVSSSRLVLLLREKLDELGQVVRLLLVGV